MTRNSILFTFLFIFLTVVSFAQTDQVENGTNLLFNGVTTRLSDAEKRQIFRNTSLELNSDGKTFSYMGLRSLSSEYAYVYPINLKGNDEEQIFICHGNNLQKGDYGFVALYIKNDNGRFKPEIYEKGKLPLVCKNPGHAYPDLVFEDKNKFNGQITYTAYQWDDKAGYKKVKGAYQNVEKGESAEVISSAYVSQAENGSAGSENSSAANTSNSAVKVITPAGNTSAIKALKAEGFYPFQEGLAIVNYGKSYGIIDKTGNFIVPYNKYLFYGFGLGSLEPTHGFVNGGCVVKNIETGKLGMIDKKGALIIPTDYILVYPYDDEGWSIVTDVNENDFFINKAGTKIPVSKALYYYRQGLISSNGSIEDLFNGGATRNRAIGGKRYNGSFYKGVSPGSSDKGTVFYNRNGKQVISAVFSSAEPFHEGLACVSKINEFGETKYGFIDLQGNTVIPFKFSNKPGNFYNGLAYVAPAAKTDFDFAFINKKGDVVIKEKDVKPVAEVDPHFEEGYFRMFKWDSRNYRNILIVIDSSGRENAVINSLKDKIGSIRKDSYTFYPLENNTQTFSSSGKSNYNNTAFVNIKTGKMISTNFITIGDFDPVSGLAIAQDIKLGYVYINQDGEIQFKMASKSEW